LLLERVPLLTSGALAEPLRGLKAAACTDVNALLGQVRSVGLGGDGLASLRRRASARSVPRPPDASDASDLAHRAPRAAHKLADSLDRQTALRCTRTRPSTPTGSTTC